jgi:excinuclease ABC subunit B
MSVAINETDRRRAVQQAYNTEHGIDPQTIRKAVAAAPVAGGVVGRGETRRDATQDETPTDIGAAIIDAEHRMLAAAERLAFEEAAKWRDRLAVLTALTTAT